MVDILKPFYAKEVSFPGASTIGECKAGIILELELHPTTYRLMNQPEKITNFIGYGRPNSENYRRGLVNKLTKNTPNSYPMVGKPSSSFIFLEKDRTLKLHYLVESRSFERKQNPVQHLIMVNFDSESGRKSYHPANLYGRNTLWSGHIANLTPEFSNVNYSWIMLLDKFSGRKFTGTNNEVEMISILHSCKIIPVSADGYFL